jgi:hypothetical protein
LLRLHLRRAFEPLGDRIPAAVDQRIAGGLAHRGLDLMATETHFHRGHVDYDFKLRIRLDRGGHLGDVLTAGGQARKTERGAVAKKISA